MLKFIHFKFPTVENVSCAFQVRDISIELFNKNEKISPYEGGNLSFNVFDNPKEVEKNRAEICNSLNVDSFSDTLQVHGSKTIFEPLPSNLEAYAPYEADGLATSKRSHALCIKTADCQPILLTDKKGEFLLAIHVGWKGNRINYPYIAVKDFCEHYQLKASDLLAVRGPSLSPQASEFINYESEWGNEFDTWFDKKNKRMNLWLLTKSQLIEAGLSEKNIFAIDLCTYFNPQLFFSYRLAQKSGRQGSFIWKNS